MLRLQLSVYWNLNLKIVFSLLISSIKLDLLSEMEEAYHVEFSTKKLFCLNHPK